MHRITENAVHVVAADTRAVLKATDQALLANANMLVSVIEGTEDSNLPVAVTQDLYARIVAHGGKLVEGREDLRQLITRLTVVKDRSNQRELATGCPLGLPDMAATSAPEMTASPNRQQPEWLLA